MFLLLSVPLLNLSSAVVASMLTLISTYEITISINVSE
jgi:hypothetical protein